MPKGGGPMGAGAAGSLLVSGNAKTLFPLQRAPWIKEGGGVQGPLVILFWDRDWGAVKFGTQGQELLVHGVGFLLLMRSIPSTYFHSHCVHNQEGCV